MSKKNTIAGVALVVACVLCVWVYIPSTNVLEDCEIGTRIWFTAVVNSSQSELLRGPYKPVDILNISCM